MDKTLDLILPRYLERFVIGERWRPPENSRIRFAKAPYIHPGHEKPASGGFVEAADDI